MLTKSMAQTFQEYPYQNGLRSLYAKGPKDEMPPPTTSKSSTPTEFPQFLKLPVEVRSRIWKYALPSARVIEFASGFIHRNGNRIFAPDRATEDWSVICTQRAPVIYFVNKEAREAVLQNGYICIKGTQAGSEAAFCHFGNDIFMLSYNRLQVQIRPLLFNLWRITGQKIKRLMVNCKYPQEWIPSMLMWKPIWITLARDMVELFELEELYIGREVVYACRNLVVRGFQEDARVRHQDFNIPRMSFAGDFHSNPRYRLATGYAKVFKDLVMRYPEWSPPEIILGRILCTSDADLKTQNSMEQPMHETT